MTPLEQIPDVHRVAIPAVQQNLRMQAGFHHVEPSPFAADDRVESQVPPEIVCELLRSSVQLPLSEDLEALVIHYENSAGAVAVRSSQRADQDAIGAAMNGVRRSVSSSRGQSLRLDHLDNFRVVRIRLGIDDMNTR